MMLTVLLMQAHFVTVSMADVLGFVKGGKIRGYFLQMSCISSKAGFFFLTRDIISPNDIVISQLCSGNLEEVDLGNTFESKKDCALIIHTTLKAEIDFCENFSLYLLCKILTDTEM